MKALVVDDSRMMRTVEQKALESMGWTVKQAANGIEAIAALADMEACDLVLADWQMPEMDGLALVKHIRKDAKWSSVTIIMVSSNAVMESIQEALDAGANDFVMKPFSVDALKDRVTEAFNG
jgi:two-component system, chemotaxis family, chemotaxis protein CheY